MADRNIQMKVRNGAEWDKVYPQTRADNVFDEEGNSLQEVLREWKLYDRFETIDLRINFIDLAIETEMLKQAQLTGVNANILIETFQTIDDIDLLRGDYDSENKRLEV